ncbi:Slp family lipoprotein [Rhodanobacter sp. MP7CTX1]|uniref:Slp family lipoprotein n=1 Tax=Rhodanobacter sp. MP7CTX1 TaxID=2723084 RepID=UPI00160FAA10|nr:Slp family lipoprotein [Rhodanobacter sp. MP7CTX1]MBB6189101.1 outer membrane lipoprotein [Rhodanobacter sp. MP7CTX1]
MRIATCSLRHLFCPLLALVLVACAPAPIYKNAPNAITAPPALVAQSPERYPGGDVIWGGRIVQVTTFANHSEIELLAYPLDSSQRPQLNDIGNGRFIAVMPGYVEPLDYPAGALMTMSGKLNGTRVGMVGEANYVFPLVSVAQSHVWTPKEMNAGRNNVQFGVGVGVGIR